MSVDTAPVPSWLRFLRRCRSVLWTAFFLVTVSLAIIVGLGRALVPYAAKLQPWLEQRLSRELGQPVNIGALTAEWQGLNPFLDLHNLRLGQAGGEAIQFDNVRLRFHILHWLLPRRDDWSLELNGVELTLVRQADGDWQVSGFDGGGGEPDYHALLELGDVTLRNSLLRVVGEALQRDVVIKEVMLRQVTQGLLLEGQLGLRDAPPLQLLARLEEPAGGAEGAARDGALQVYLQARGQPLQTWLGLVDRRFASVRAEAGTGPALFSVPEGAPATADVNLWLDWFGPEQGQLAATVSVQHATATAAAATPAATTVSASLWLDWAAQQWSLTVADLGFGSAPALSDNRLLPDGLLPDILLPDRLRPDAVSEAGDPAPGWLRVQHESGTVVYGDGVDLAVLPRLAAWWPQAPEVLRRSGLGGRLRDFSAASDAQGVWQYARARLDNLDFPAARQQPGCDDLTGELIYRNGRGQIQLSGGQLMVPSVFPEPLPVQQLTMDFDMRTQGGGWALHLPALRWDTGTFQLLANGHYFNPPAPVDRATPAPATATVVTRPSPESGAAPPPGRQPPPHPWLELNVAIPELPLAGSSRFLPLGVMGRRTGQWLQSGLKAGRLENIRAVFQGHPQDWPFAANQGMFRASAQVVNTDLSFNADWPLVEQLNGRISFTPKTMRIDRARVEFAAAEVQELEAYIADMDDAVLELTVQSRADAARHLHMLGQLPLRAGAWVEHTALSLSGPSEIAADVSVDFRAGRSDANVSGEARFLGVHADYQQRLLLDELSGAFAFNNDGLVPADFSAKWRGRPARLRLGAEPFSVALSGRFDIAQVLDIAGVNPLWQRYLQGESLWHWHLTPAGSGSYLQAQSDLVGVAVQLPDPLAKLPPIPRRLRVAIPFGDDIPVQVNYAGEVDAMVMLDEASQVQGVNLALRHGCDRMVADCAPFAAPPQPGNGWLGGSGAVADLMGWVDVIDALAAAGEGADAGLAWRGNARFQRLQLLGRYFGDVRMAFQRRGEHWGVNFEGPELLGRVRLPAGDSASNTVVAEFERLYLPPPPETAAAMVYTDPKTMPALHLYAEDLHWDNWPVGQIQMQAFPVENGLRFETIEATNPVFTLTGQGEWRRDDSGVASELQLRVDAEQLGSLLESLGYGALVEGGQTSIALDGEWPGGPADFALARLSGSLDVNVVQGRFTEAGPGAGRMLGLISVQALPRRILLDFRDVFETGLNFDRLHGQFQLAGGYATTQGLEIDSTAAKIVISGRTDLVNREYDQHVSIRPGLGSTLPVIGAIAGGPVGATAGLALQGLLQKPLGGLTEVTYHVVGPWDDPQVLDSAEGAARQEPDLPKPPAAGERSPHKAD